MAVLFFVMCACVLVKVASQLASQRVPMEMREWVLRPGKICALVADGDRPGREMLWVCMDAMVDPLGSCTDRGLFVG